MRSLNIQILEKARDLIADEGRWCRGYFAQLSDGDAIVELGFGLKDRKLFAKSTKFCALGALYRTLIQVFPNDPDVFEMYQTLRRELGFSTHGEPTGTGVANVNDGHGGHEAILRVYDKTIERLVKTEVRA